jgi:DNA-binding XRE family transcriptional regulator
MAEMLHMTQSTYSRIEQKDENLTIAIDLLKLLRSLFQGAPHVINLKNIEILLYIR